MSCRIEVLKVFKSHIAYIIAKKRQFKWIQIKFNIAKKHVTTWNKLFSLYSQIKWKVKSWCYFTLSHLADAFIQSDLQIRKSK